MWYNNHGDALMRILKLNIKNYRNLSENSFDFDEKTNYIYGQNAQGKTNLLEAIWMFTGARSFRKTKDANLIKFSENSARLDGNFFLEKRNQKISINFAEDKRKIFLNGIAKKYPTEMIGKFRTVLFTPLHLSLVKDGPDNRRKFLDAAICQLEPSFTKLMIAYNQSLKQRNALLRIMIKKQSLNEPSLEIWDSKLAFFGARIIKMRINYLSKLKVEAENAYFEISKGKEILGINYLSTVCKNEALLADEKSLEENFLLRLKDSKNSDLKQGFTTIGPHKDDLEILLGGKSIKHFGSQGQQRSAVLALKIAEASVLEESICEPPVILLDDVMSELDEYRQKYVMSRLGSGQTFITGCDRDLIKYFGSASTFHIKNGGLENG